MGLVSLVRRVLRDINAEDAPVKVLCDGDLWDVADVVYDRANGCIIVQVQ